MRRTRPRRGRKGDGNPPPRVGRRPPRRPRDAAAAGKRRRRRSPRRNPRMTRRTRRRTPTRPPRTATPRPRCRPRRPSTSQAASPTPSSTPNSTSTPSRPEPRHSSRNSPRSSTTATRRTRSSGGWTPSRRRLPNSPITNGGYGTGRRASDGAHAPSWRRRAPPRRLKPCDWRTNVAARRKRRWRRSERRRRLRLAWTNTGRSERRSTSSGPAGRRFASRSRSSLPGWSRTATRRTT
mmetsp:Transcript_8445/g.38068  ORF Transcript_8445/g.38068 Transcript_8445/m.38068 type:complete len:237 (-) Transcript_8445:1374-2084(-)